VLTRLLPLLLCLASQPGVFAQTSSPIQIRVRQQNDVFIVPNGSTLNLGASGVNQPVTVNVTITYQGNTSAIFVTEPALVGSTAFRFTSIGSLPLTLQQNQSFSFEITYVPTSSAAAGAQLSLGYVQPGLIPGSPSAASNILLNLAGGTPELSLSYALSTNGNLTPIASGGTLSFGEVQQNATTTATFLVVNRGSAPGPVSAVKLTGEAFQLVSLPLLPASVPSNGSLQFGIRYSPKAIRADEGRLELTLGSQVVTLLLSGSGIGSNFTYELIPEEGDRRPIQPNQSITVPDTKVGERVVYTVQARNSGNATGQVNIISLSGTQFALADLPFLPFTLNPNEFLTFTLAFTPTQPGRLTGRLRIGNDVFDLVGNGIGSRLTYSYNTGSTTTTVQSPGTVLFSGLPVGQSGVTRFEIRNEGTAAATLSSIGVTDVRGVFRVDGSPQLPLQLEPASSTGFNLVFTPNAPGLATAQLLIDTQLFTLTGIASPPPPLPGYVIGGPSGTVAPSEQPAVRLTLLDRYPLPVQGVLTLTIESEAFSADPAVQFSAGGRSVSFTIPANTTEAIFPNGSREIRLQTGTVAGTLTLTPSFATTSGFSLTPDLANLTVSRLTVPRRAPVILSAQVAARTADSLTIVISGYTTTRSLQSASIQFTAKPGAALASSSFTINLEGISDSWFRTAASESFGGQFSLTLPFTFRSGTPTTQPLIDSLESVGLTVVNGTGSSNRSSVTLQ
jgi:hypothetical protein